MALPSTLIMLEIQVTSEQNTRVDPGVRCDGNHQNNIVRSALPLNTTGLQTQLWTKMPPDKIKFYRILTQKNSLKGIINIHIWEAIIKNHETKLMNFQLG